MSNLKDKYTTVGRDEKDKAAISIDTYALIDGLDALTKAIYKLKTSMEKVR